MEQTVLITIEPAAAEITAGDQGIIRVRLHNRGKDVAYCRLRLAGFDSSWAQIEPDQIAAFPGEEASARVRLNPPAVTPAATYHAMLRAVRAEDQDVLGVAAFDLTVRPVTGTVQPARPEPILSGGASPTPAPAPLAPRFVPAIRASSSDARLEIGADRAEIMLLAGSQGRVNLSVANLTGSPLSAVLSLQGLPGSWAQIAPAQAGLAPLQSVPATLDLKTPANIPPGSYPFAVMVEMPGRANTTARLSMILALGEADDRTLEVIPSDATGQTGASYQVRISQTGDRQGRFRLSAGGDEGCDFTFDPDVIIVPSGGSNAARLTVQVRTGLVGSDTRTYLFTVTATSLEAGTAPIHASARFTQKRAEPLQLRLDPGQQSGSGEVRYAVTLVNTSEIEATVQLKAADTKDTCRFSFSPATLVAPPRKSAQSVLTVIPLVLRDEPGEETHEFSVIAQPAGELLAPTTTKGRYVQTRASGPGLILQPSSVNASGPARFALQVSNPRPSPLTLELRPVALNSPCEVNVQPAQLLIPPGGRATARVIVRPTEHLTGSETQRVCRFAVEAQAPDMPNPTVAEGSLIQVLPRLRPAAFLPWLLAALLLLVLLVLFRLVFGSEAGGASVLSAPIDRAATSVADAQLRAEAVADVAQVTAEARRSRETATALAAAAQSTATAEAIKAEGTRQAQAAQATVDALAAQSAAAQAAAEAAEAAAAANTAALQATASAAETAAEAQAMRRASPHYVASLDAVMTGIGFFLGGDPPPEVGARYYQTTFAPSQASDIYWEISLEHPDPGRVLPFTVTATLYGPDGTMLATSTTTSALQPGTTSSVHTSDYGWLAGTPLAAGVYRVNIQINGLSSADVALVIA